MGKVETVILAAVGGLVAGLLLAPKSGKETRQDLTDKANDLKEKASRGAEQFKSGASSVGQEIKEGAQNVKEEVTRRGETVKNEAEETARKTRRASQ